MVSVILFVRLKDAFSLNHKGGFSRTRDHTLYKLVDLPCLKVTKWHRGVSLEPMGITSYILWCKIYITKALMEVTALVNLASRQDNLQTYRSKHLWQTKAKICLSGHSSQFLLKTEKVLNNNKKYKSFNSR